MIALTLTPDGKLTITQQTTFPLVYLDQWVWLKLARGEDCCRQFVEPLARRGGTVAYSLMHHLEFATPSARDDLRGVESIFRSLWPHMAFLNFEPSSVIEREDALLRGQRVGAPHLDEELLRCYLAFDRRGLDPLDPDGFLAYLREPSWSQGFQSTWRSACQVFERYLADLRSRYQVNAGKSSVVDFPRSDLRSQHPTRHVYVEGLRQFEKGNLDLTNCHHYADFFHMVVAVSYCDLVVLDRNGEEQARQIQKALKSKDLLTHKARVFSDSNLSDLLQALAP